MLPLAALVAVSCSLRGAPPNRDADVTLPRTFEARLSVGQQFAPCRGRLIACAPTETSASDTLVARVLASGDRRDKLRLDLAFAYQDSTVLDRTVRTFALLSDDQAHPDDDAVDLSAALLARYARGHRVPDLLQALEAALRGVEKGRRNAAARYNVALAARELRLVHTEQAAWSAYRALDSTSGWAQEAGRQLQQGAGMRGVGVLAPNDPQALREAAMTDWIAAWADGIQAGDLARADTAAARVRAAAASLSGSPNDQTVSLVAAALPKRAVQTPLTRALAVAITQLTTAERQYAETRYDSAAIAFGRVLRSEAPPVITQWARLGAAASSLYLSGPAVARPELARIAGSTPSSLPALEGRARWLVGTALLREGRHSEAIASFARAATLFAACGEQGNVGATIYLQGEATLALGDFDEAGRLLVQALAMLEGRPPSVWYHNALVVLTKLSGAFGLPRVEATVASEDVQVAASLSAVYRVEASLTRARLGLASYASDLQHSDTLLTSLPPGPTREWLASQSKVVRGSDATLDVRTRLASLDSAVTFFAERSVTRWLPAVSLRASMLLGAGRIPAALRDLRAAHAALESERQRLTAEGARIRLLNQVRRIYENLAATMVANGDTVGGLEIVEEMRALPVPHDDTRVGDAVPDGNRRNVAVTFAMNGDSILAWMRVGGRVQFSMWSVQRAELERLLLDLRRTVELDQEDVRRQDAILQRLFELLLSPLEPQLRTARRITFGVAGLLATVPFAALKSGDNRYVAERWIVCVAGRAHPWVEATTAPGKQSSALLVAATQSGTTSREPLHVVEADAMRSAYPALVELRAESVQKHQVVATMRSARVVHFAGHAIGDSRVPGDGFLVLGTGAGGEVQRLTGAEIALLALPRLELVVLAACESGSVVIDTESDALPLARAFALAGARVVVGSLWRVDDRATGTLLGHFYTSLAAGEDPPQALRSAQLLMMRHANPAFRSPAAWAGFSVNVTS